jgi:hypothetical protein
MDAADFSEILVLLTANTRSRIPDIYFSISACSTEPGIFQFCGTASLNITARSAVKLIFIGLIALCNVTLHRAINRSERRLDTHIHAHYNLRAILRPLFCDKSFFFLLKRIYKRPFIFLLHFLRRVNKTSVTVLQGYSQISP